MNISGGEKELLPVLYLCASDPLAHVEDVSSLVRYGLDLINSNQNDVNPYKELSEGLGSLAAAANISLESKTKTGRLPDIGAENIEGELELNTDEARYVINAQIAKLKSGREEIERTNNLVRENRRILDQLDHVGDIAADLDTLFGFEFFKFRFGHMPREAYDSIAIYGAVDMDDVFFIPSYIEKHEVWGIYFTPRTKSLKVDSMFSVLHFERVRISEKAHGTPESARIELEREIESANLKIDGLNAAFAEAVSEAAGIIEKYSEIVRMLYSIYELRKKTARSASSFHMTVWLPESRVEEFSKRLARFPDVVAPVNSPADVPYIKPPTLLKNFFLFRPFEQFVKMYGLPSYNEIDPTPFLALTYILCFGIMFGDLGQGLVISLAGFLIWRLKRINLGRIIGILGLSSAVFGVIFGSVFGLEDIIRGYNPLEHINEVLIAAVGLGIIIVSCAIVINIINGIKQRSTEKVLFSHNGLAGLIFYWAAVIAVLSVMNFASFGTGVSIFIFAAVFCGILIYLKEPLSNFINKKKKIIPENPAEFFTVNIFELFEIVLSFLTNTISFIRVGAFALNHVGMMSVVLLLARTASGGKNPVVMIIGNITVIALEGLIVGIQCLRLQYYEIFGRFFEGGGRNFGED